MSFADFMNSGFDGCVATMNDFCMHMKSIWMDVRLRETLEIRCIDSLPPHLVPSVPAFIKGLVCYGPSFEQVERLVSDWSYAEYRCLLEDVSKNGLQASFRGKKVLDMAKDLLDLAEDGLKKERILDINGRDESMYLQPIKEFVFVKGRSPAEWLVQCWENEWQRNFYPVFKWCGY